MTDQTPLQRRPTNLSLDTALVAEARGLGVNLSRAAEAGIRDAVRAESGRRWQEENREALLSSNAYVQEQGLPLTKHRMF